MTVTKEVGHEKAGVGERGWGGGGEIPWIGGKPKL